MFWLRYLQLNGTQKHGRENLLCLAILLLLGLCARTGHASTWASGADVLDSRPAADVCEAKTINYITHTLPQQCFRTAWTGPTPAPEASNLVALHPASDATPPNGTESTEGEPGEDQKKDANEELATSSFMSFEEWKEMMLHKSGQDPANLKTRKDGHQPNHGAARDPGLGDGGIDALADDLEINFDFDALSEKVSELTGSSSGGDKGGGEAGEPTAAEREEQVLYENGMAYYYRSKDAGKTCKERFSYSSFDAGATVLKTSPGAKNAKALLVENKDTYMLLECHQKQKFVIVELSDDILVDTVVLANFEFFSSMIRKFKVSVSDRYPVKPDKWVHLGTFEAKNSRDIQAFLVEHPQIYTKYVRIEFLNHYGTEYYCPVSLLRVHGTRMLDSWKEPDNILEEELEEVAVAAGTEPEPEASSTPVEEPSAEPGTEPVVAEKAEGHPDVSQNNETCPALWHPFFYQRPSLDMCMASSPTVVPPTPVSSDGTSQSPSSPGQEAATAAQVDAYVLVSPNVSESNSSTWTVPVAGNASSSASQPTKSTSVSSTFTRPAASTATTAAASQKPTAVHATETTSSPSSPTATQASSTSRSKASPTASAPLSSPTVQESFFKAVNKRLQHLESNTSLSLQYIEEQSRFLQEALTKMEKKQIARVDAFLDTLNKTVLMELRNVRTQYDQIWQSTVIALETQREQSAREVVALTGRLNVLADEVVFQKRMAILQSLVLLACLVLVMFSRGAPAFAAGFDFNGPQSPQRTPPRPAAASSSSLASGPIGAGLLSSVMNLMAPESPPSSARHDYAPRLTRTGTASVHLPMRFSTASAARRSASQPENGSCQPRTLSYNHDKVLPLTPAPVYNEHSTPIPHIDDVDSDSHFHATADEGQSSASHMPSPPHSQADTDADFPLSHPADSKRHTKASRQPRTGTSGLRSDTFDSASSSPVTSDSRPMTPPLSYRELSPVPEQEQEQDESQTPTFSTVNGLKSLPSLPDNSG